MSPFRPSLRQRLSTNHLRVMGLSHVIHWDQATLRCATACGVIFRNCQKARIFAVPNWVASKSRRIHDNNLSDTSSNASIALGLTRRRIWVINETRQLMGIISATEFSFIVQDLMNHGTIQCQIRSERRACSVHHFRFGAVHGETHHVPNISKVRLFSSGIRYSGVKSLSPVQCLTPNRFGCFAAVRSSNEMPTLVFNRAQATPSFSGSLLQQNQHQSDRQKTRLVRRKSSSSNQAYGCGECAGRSPLTPSMETV